MRLRNGFYIQKFKMKLIAFSLSIFLLSCGKSDPELNNPQVNGAANYTISGSTGIIADGVSTSEITITLINASGSPEVGVVPTFEATGSNNIYGPCSATDSSGISTCSLSSTTAEIKDINLSGLASIDGAKVLFVHDTESQLNFLVSPPANITANQTFSSSPKLILLDPNNNPTINSISNVVMEAFSDSSCTTLVPGVVASSAPSNTVNPNGTSATYEFAGTKFVTPGSYYLGFRTDSAPILTTCSSSSILVSGTLSYHLEFSTQPSPTAKAGVPFSTQPIVQILDQNGNPASEAGIHNALVTLTPYTDASCTTSPVSGGSLRGNFAVNGNSGTANNFNADYTEIETIYLKASSLTGITETCSTGINVTVGPASLLTSSITGSTPVAANSYHYSKVVINLADEFGHPISSPAPSFSADDGGGDNIYDACLLSATPGQFNCKLKSSQVESKVLSISTPIAKSGDTVNFIIAPDAANSSASGTTVIADGATPSIITITLKDSSNNPVVGLIPQYNALDSGESNVYSSNDTEFGGGSCSATDASGVSTCAMSSTFAEVKDINFSMPLLRPNAGTVEFLAGPADPALSTITGTSPHIADGIDQSIVTITLRDAFNNRVPGVTPSFSATDTGSTNNYNPNSNPTNCNTTNSSGIALCYLTSTKAEVKTLQIESPVVKADGTVTFSPGALDHLTFVTQPSSIVEVDVNFPVQPIVELRDQYENVRTTDTDLVTLSPWANDPTCSSDPGTGNLNNNTQNANGTNGQAPFTSLNYDKSGFLYIKAEANGKIGCSEVVSVNAGLPTKLSFVQNPQNIVSMNAFSPALSVELQDSYGNRVTDPTYNNIPIALSIDTDTSLAGDAVLQSLSAFPLTAFTNNGIATFVNDITIDKAGSSYTLGASASAAPLTDAISNTFDVTVGPPSQIGFKIGPSNTVAGISINDFPSVEILDAGGNLTSATYNISIDIGTNPSSGTLLNAPHAVDAVAGSASFNNIKIDKSGIGYTLVATCNDPACHSFATTESNPFNITFAPVAQLIWLSQPQDPTIVTVQMPSFEIQQQDQYGNPVLNNDPIRISFQADPSLGTATLGGTLQVAANSSTGNATFSDISVDKAFNGYQLEAKIGTAPNVITSDPSDLFDIIVGPPDHLAFTTQPLDALAGAQITPATDIQVEIQDLGNNRTTDTCQVTLSIDAGSLPTSSPTLTIGGGNNVWVVPGGVATFTNVSIDKVHTGYKLKATCATVPNDALSDTFNISPAAPDHLLFVNHPEDTPAGTTINPGPAPATENITLNLLDAYDNLITNAAYDVSLGIGVDPSSGATLSGTSTVNSGTGIFSFSGLSIDKIGTGFKLNATTTAPSVSALLSNTFDILVSPATKLVFDVQPMDAISNTNMTTAIQVSFRDNGDNLVSLTENITLSLVAPNGATISGQVEAGVAGVATFTNFKVDLIGTYTLRADATVPTTGAITSASDSISFNITSGPPDHLVFSVQPPALPLTTVAGSAVSSFTVDILDAAGNLTDTTTETVTLVLTDGTPIISGATSTPTALTPGQAVFDSTIIQKSGAVFTFKATSPTTLGAGEPSGEVSGAFTIVPAAANTLVFNNQPSDTEAGLVISTPTFISAELYDQYSNLCTNDSTTNISISLGTNPSSATLLGTTTLSATAGVVTFSDLSIQKIGTGYDLVATSGSMNDTSSSFNITSGPVDHFTYFSPAVGAPDPIIVGGNSTDIEAIVVDQYGNVVPSATISLNSASGLPGDAGSTTDATTDSNGLATFTLTSSTVAGTYAYYATSNGISTNTQTGPLADVSRTFSPDVVSAIALSLTGSNTVIADNGVSSTTLSAAAVDQYGNTVNAGEILTLSPPANGGSVTTNNLATDASGIVTFTLNSTGALPGVYSNYTVSHAATSTTSNDLTATPIEFLEPNVVLQWWDTSPVELAGPINFGQPGVLVSHTYELRNYGANDAVAISVTTVNGPVSSGNAVNDFDIDTADFCNGVTLRTYQVYGDSCQVTLNFHGAQNRPAKQEYRDIYLRGEEQSGTSIVDVYAEGTVL